MSVYVSPMQRSLKNKKWPYSHHCYLIADSIPELKRFAVGLGLRIEWFQSKSMPHFDLTFGMRAAAIRAGAIKIDNKTLVEKLREQRI